MREIDAVYGFGMVSDLFLLLVAISAQFNSRTEISFTQEFILHSHRCSAQRWQDITSSSHLERESAVWSSALALVMRAPASGRSAGHETSILFRFRFQLSCQP